MGLFHCPAVVKNMALFFFDVSLYPQNLYSTDMAKAMSAINQHQARDATSVFAKVVMLTTGIAKTHYKTFRNGILTNSTDKIYNIRFRFFSLDLL